MEKKNRGIGGIALFAIIVVVAVLGGAFVYMYGKNTASVQQKSTATIPTPAPESVTVSAAPADTTDAGLTKDSATVDTQLKASDTDSTNIDAGLNDVQGNLSEQ